MSDPRRRSLRAILRRDPNRGTIATKKDGDWGRTLLVVVPITLLIWVYAERAQNRDEDIAAVLAIVSSESSLAVETSDLTNNSVRISLNGPRSQIDALKRSIEDRTVDGRFPVPLPAIDSSIGERPIDLTRLLNDNALFSKSGVTVMKTSPSQVRIAVEKVSTRSVSVVLPKESPVTLQSYSFDPAKVTIRGPESVLETDFGGERPSIAVDLAGLREGVGSGVRSLEVPIVPPRNPRVTSQPPRVKMTFEIGSTLREVLVPSAGILIERPVGEDGRSKVVIRRGPVINNVQLRGPANIVNNYVGDRPEPLQAVLQVSQDDAGRGPQTRAVRFPYLERGIEAVGGPYEVTFEVTNMSPDLDR